ncbi:nitroreductase family protein [Pseudomonas piscis]
MTANALSKLNARYGATDISPVTQWNEVIEQLLDHRSVRAFTDQPLPEGTIETLVAAAQSASTSSNLQVWSVVAVQDVDRKKRLSAFAGNPGLYPSSPVIPGMACRPVPGLAHR